SSHGLRPSSPATGEREIKGAQKAQALYRGFSMNIYELSALEIAKQVRVKKLSARDVVRAFLDRLRAWDPKLKAFVSVQEEAALEQARAVDEKIALGEDAGVLA